VKTAGPRPIDLLIDATLDQHDVDVGQRQLARQHQSGRTATYDHHRMLGDAGSDF
jgi:hypothetical protein